uniref:Myosin motor domain-containing protein n=1 Tax=Ditylenchus dipsaci TaxID=166011 RepID=A0A915E9F1_9BILA
MMFGHCTAYAQNAEAAADNQTSHPHNRESGAAKTENQKVYWIPHLCMQPMLQAVVQWAVLKQVWIANLSAGVALEAFSCDCSQHTTALDWENLFATISRKTMLNSARMTATSWKNQEYNSLCSSQKLRALGLTKKPSDYRFLNQGGAVTDHQIDDCENGLALKSKALEQLNFSHAEQGWILECVAACVLIGEVRFGERQGLDMSFVEDFGALDSVAKLAGVNSYKLMEALTQPSIRIGESVIKKNQGLKKVHGGSKEALIHVSGCSVELRVMFNRKSDEPPLSVFSSSSQRPLFELPPTLNGSSYNFLWRFN